VFDASGKYLYFFASTDAGPVNKRFAQSNADMRVRRGIYLVALKKGTPSPLARESDEETPAADKPKQDKPKEDKPKEEQPKEERPTARAEPVVLDLEGMVHRGVALPVPDGNYTSLRAGAAGQVFYLELPPPPPPARNAPPPGATLQRFDLSKRKSEAVTTG